jgi:hypothetical protein
MVFLEIILVGFGSGISHPAAPTQCLTDGSFGKQTVVIEFLFLSFGPLANFSLFWYCFGF